MKILLNLLKRIRYIGHPLVRDYTENAEEQMKFIARKVNDGNINDNIVGDTIGKFLDNMGLLEYIVGINKYQESIIDCYNYHIKDIESICEQVRELDSHYGSKIAQITYQSENILSLINGLNNCLEPSKTYDSELRISDRLYGIYDDDKMNETEKDSRKWYYQQMNQEILKEDILYFCSNPDSKNIFINYSDADIISLSKFDVVFLSTGSVMYKGIEMTIDELLSKLSKEDYSEKIVRLELDSLISSVISTNSTATAKMKDWEEAKEAVESLIKDYLGNEDSNSVFKEFVNSIGGIDVVKELCKTAPRLIDYLFSDYSKGLELLDGLEYGCNDEMASAIERLRHEYNNKWMGVLGNVSDFNVNMIKNITQKGVKDWFKEECGDSSVILALVNQTDLKTKTEEAHKFFALKKIQNDLQQNYKIAIEKVNSGDYEDTDIEAVKNTFSMLKENTKNIYATYSNMCKGDVAKQMVLNNKIDEIDKLKV